METQNYSAFKNGQRYFAISIEYLLSLLLPYMHIKEHIRVIYYFCVVVIFSLIKAGEDLLHLEYFTGKYSIFNQFFVKMGWGWTLSAILLLHLCCLPFCADRKRHFGALITRAFCLTAIFYFWCHIFFPLIEGQSGMCVRNGVVVPGSVGKRECRRIPANFVATDLSGHSFLLPFCALALMRESVHVLRVLSLAANEGDVSDSLDSFTEGELIRLRERRGVVVSLAIGGIIFAALLSLLWDAMLVVTTLYYHTVVEKVIGASLAVASWASMYHKLFPIIGVS